MPFGACITQACGPDPVDFWLLCDLRDDFRHTWNAKCPSFLGNFTPKTSN